MKHAILQQLFRHKQIVTPTYLFALVRNLIFLLSNHMLGICMNE